MGEIELLRTAVGISAVAFGLLVVLLWKLDGKQNQELERALREEFKSGRKEGSEAAQALREEVANAHKTSNDSIVKVISALTANNEQKLEKLRETLDTQIKQLQDSNEKKLDQMRETVDEKLQTTLEKRLGESFKLVSERLEAVQKGLGEMKTLADDVGGLQRVLTNVKSRGTWGEVQLQALLEQILTPDQYATNVETREGSGQRVEFAIRLPGEGDKDSPVWLPIDSKFPKDDYDRLVDAAEAADKEGVDQALKALSRAVELSAKDISKKYVQPPDTTDFAIMFMPTEGLYAEIVKQPGLVSSLQEKHRVVVTGPTTLSATLSSLRMGFRTLAIQQRSSEVWKVLAAVKGEFGKFGVVLDKVSKQLHTATNTIDTDLGRRTRVMEKRLREVENLPGVSSGSVLESLGLDEDPDDTDD
jgi:DNA recombination protein RmuC